MKSPVRHLFKTEYGPEWFNSGGICPREEDDPTIEVYRDTRVWSINGEGIVEEDLSESTRITLTQVKELFGW